MDLIIKIIMSMDLVDLLRDYQWENEITFLYVVCDLVASNLLYLITILPISISHSMLFQSQSHY